MGFVFRYSSAEIRLVVSLDIKMPRESNKLTYLIAAETVIRQAGRPLSARELVDQAIADRLLPNATWAKTPQKSMQARLSMHILKHGVTSTFVRTSPGRFNLREFLQESAGSQSVRPFDRVLARERVLCIPREDYEDLLTFQGIADDAASLLQNLGIEGRTMYLPRAEAENDPEHKQVVTYTLVQYQNFVLSFQRGQFSRVASFLKGARSIGFGGHVTEGDANIFGYTDRGIRACAARELEEELQRPLSRLRIDENDLEVLGILNDDSSDVGRKHVAVVMRYWVDDWQRWRTVREGETSVRKLEWTNFVSGDIDLNEFEYWSQMCFRRYFPETTAQQSQFRTMREVDLLSDHLLLVVGTIGSGKTHTARLLAENLGYTVVNSGEVVANLAGLPPIPNTSREKFQAAAWDLVSTEEGEHRLASALVESARAMDGNRVIIDGIRQLGTFNAVRTLWPDPVYTLFVQTPPDLAFESYRFRETELSIRAFMDLYDAAVERGVHDIARRADIIVYNWFGEESHRRVLSALVRSLSSKSEANRARRRV